MRGTEVRLDNDSIARIFFRKDTGTYQTLDIDCPDAGQHLLQLIATGASGLPDIVSLRIFPLDGQPLPSQEQHLSVPALRSDAHSTLDIYSLSGQLIGHTTEAQLGRFLGRRSSALIALPGSAGSALCIVRRQQ